MTTQAERRIRKGLARSLRCAINDEAFLQTLKVLGDLSGFAKDRPVEAGLADDGNLVVRMNFDGNRPVYLNVKVTVMTG